MSNSKKCFACKKIVLYELYTKKTGTKDGLNSTCKPCVKLREVQRALDKLSPDYVDKTTLNYRAKSFKIRGAKIHSGKYLYDRVVYENSHKQVEIFCTKHLKYFWQNPHDHTSGKGCLDCANETIAAKLTLSTDEWIVKAVAAQGTNYNYSEADYRGDSEKLLIICNSCGTRFYQIAGNHLRGNGCSKCAKYGYKDNLPAYVYIMTHKEMTKVGITNRKPSSRASQINKSGMAFEVVFEAYSDSGLSARSVEKEIKSHLRDSYAPITDKFDGYTETFVGVCLNDLVNRIEDSLTRLSVQL